MAVRFFSIVISCVVLLLATPACQGSGKDKKAKGKPISEQPPEVKAVTAVFDILQTALRAGDAKTAWDLFSDDMRQGMNMKMQAILEKPDDLLQKQYGATKADLQGLTGVEIYAKLLSTAELEKKLAADGMPKIQRVHREADGGMRIFYKLQTGKCSQLFVQVDAAWKVARAPNCDK